MEFILVDDWNIETDKPNTDYIKYKKGKEAHRVSVEGKWICYKDNDCPHDHKYCDEQCETLYEKDMDVVYNQEEKDAAYTEVWAA